MVKKKKNLLKIVLVPILLMVLVQGMVPFITLVFSGIKSGLEENTISMDSHMVENSKVVLESAMVEKWRSIYDKSDDLGKALGEVLEKNNISIEEFIKAEEIQQEYLEKVFPDMVNTLQYNTATGVFMVLANEGHLAEEGFYKGFFLRDSEPQSRNSMNTDILMEKGNKVLAHNMSISLDSAWSTDFHFMGNKTRSADDFFYIPYITALYNKESKTEDLGYWSKPFILEENYVDNHQMITYSVPLFYNKTVYGVLGIEVSVNYLLSYFSIQELDSSLNAGYAVMIDKGNDQYEDLIGKGTLYDAVAGGEDMLVLKKDSKSTLYKVEDAKVGSQNIYAIKEKLALYNNNVPYEDTEWVVCGFVTENSVYGLGRSVYIRMIIATVISAIIVGVLVYFLIKRVTKPVYGLVKSVRKGITGIHNFKTSNIIEIDELHDVIENLIDAQKQTAEQLLEEKEKYRIAVECSKDTFFSYRREEKILEIVNSGSSDGIWDCNKHPEFVNGDCVYPEDDHKLLKEINSEKRNIYIELRLRKSKEYDYVWVSISGSIMHDDKGERNRIVGCIQNINQRKILEEAQKNNQIYDELTSFYRYEYGIEAIRHEMEMKENGSLVLLDMNNFSSINEKYGLVFGDLVLERLAVILKNCCKKYEFEDAILVRAGGDELILWMKNVKETKAAEFIEEVQKTLKSLTDERYLELSFKCGITEIKGEWNVEEGILRVKKALAAAKYKIKDIVLYEKLNNTEKKDSKVKDFTNIESFESIKQISLPSLFLNLFDRGENIGVIMDILSVKLEEKYKLSNLLITQFDKENMVNSSIYCRHGNRDNAAEDMQRINKSEYKKFIEERNVQKLIFADRSNEYKSIIGNFINNMQCVIFHMTDEGQYSGTILFAGIDEEVLKKEEEQKNLSEICAVIQNRINLQRHDLSAKAKADFLARMSHEIRTPMNGIIGMTNIALKKEQSDRERIECLRKIENSSNYLLGLLNDILDMSKIENGKMRLVYEKCNLKSILENLDYLAQANGEQKKINFKKKIDLKHNWFICDELRINQILVNIIGNAVKYSHENGTVTLTVKETITGTGKSEVYFSVSDNGVGIAKEKQQIIFKSFEQADDSKKTRRQGTGLGLSICDRLVHMMNSEIELESEEGKGSTFSFTLGLEFVDAKEDTYKTKENNLKLKGKRILVVEDNLINMEIISTILEKYEAMIDKAYNGKEAVDKMKNASDNEYALILMDIMMPEMDGIEATREIRKIPGDYYKKIPIIAMSANAFDEDVKKSIASGMNGHLSKPINVKKLEEMLNNIVRRDES